ncbi:diaminobutyrate-2-oxoglutarate transaminase [Streptomyces griseochromogenes]|uniref:Diaminobutyrate--2-oxoglutarate transaminase n=1 Tax=Streptomyces griseochromogenes TaxID=68214 RepID=A0A1B1B3V6_9ACTN|nr:diaminobutyrate--2-oxoglutarate transaminase family protein [Streptomyces griseochromogenes]ANP53490.1 diaminobutyrate--2-oxoglutarate transaminase [Streptomyces griseochromogenes]MBP2054683.1 diaminobutyrate-2-oxoglutarate transaminase [Streptomyces griseochromogenes]
MHGNTELLQFQEHHESSARTYPRNLPLAIQRAFGSHVLDMEGTSYIDFLSGAGVLALGHGHPRVLDAIREQLDLLTHGLDIPTPVKAEFTRRHLQMLPPGMRDRMRVHFCGPTGADAVEAAVKLCKTATGRSDVVAYQGGYHGCTAGAMALTSLVAPKRQVANLMPGVHFMPYSYCAQCPLRLSPDSCDVNCVALLESALSDSHAGFTTPAAVILELVQGEGGSIPAHPEFVRRVREATRAAGVPLVVDEIQTGAGRTGTWFAFEQYGIEPDVILLSKAIGGGLPVSLMLYDQALDVWEPGSHIGTFRGNQLAFAAGLAVLDVFEKEDVLANVRARSAQAFAALTPLETELPTVLQVRGKGLMIGVELAGTPAVDAGELAREVQRVCFEGGLLIERGGRDDRVLRLLPPLNISEETFARGLDILATAVRETTRRHLPAASLI